MLTQNINTTTRLQISYILFNAFYKFLTFKSEKSNSTCVFFKSNKTYYFLLHCRLSTSFFSLHLAEIFSYELFLKNYNNVKLDGCSTHANTQSCNETSVVVYNLHNLLFNSRLFIFTTTSLTRSPVTPIETITELFTNANWLEREVSELHGIHFLFKKDLRNLMLQYGDSSTPFKKNIPIYWVSWNHLWLVNRFGGAKQNRSSELAYRLKLLRYVELINSYQSLCHLVLEIYQ